MNRTITQLLSSLEIKGIAYESTCASTLELNSVSAWDEYRGQGELTFYRGKNVRMIESKSGEGGCVIVSSTLRKHLSNGNYVFVQNPDLAFIYLSEQFTRPVNVGVHSTAIISREAKIGSNVSVGAGAVIGSAVIGHNVQIGPRVVISDACEIGNGVTILSGANLGEAGLGSIMDNDGNHVLFPHFGKLIVKNDVTIGAGTIINSGSLKNTVIEENTHISGQCFIAHNCHIGERSYLAAGASLAGSVTIGKRCYLGMRCLIKEGVTVSDEVTVGMGVEIHKTIKEPGITMVSSNTPKNIGNMFSLKRK